MKKYWDTPLSSPPVKEVTYGLPPLLQGVEKKHVGETKRCLKFRLDEHLADINMSATTIRQRIISKRLQIITYWYI